MLEEKIILITGALGQAGRSAARLFLEKGARLALCDRRPLADAPEVERLREQVGDRRFLFIEADVCTEEGAAALIARVEEHYGRLDGLYHNVYTNVWKPLLDLSLTEWEETLKGTMTSAYLVCREAVPLMIRSGGGSIVNTSSILGQVPKKGCLAYGAGKAGLNQFTRVLAVDYAASGIRANVVVPGDFKSDEVLARQSEKSRQAMREETLAGRSGRADEINEVAAFLLSDAASYVTASLYTVDGGYRL
ncbi:NAD(P)-dependent oxidoreductase [Paenibacillus sp. J31TS4]|uniref:SDR family NAD(P)-dependent oxidoreductase n=1 Tax=Paenibacillus sp. J31TS4 TaxID=2807195 RepID=UPI001B0DCA30|nr:SDR family oxidoreductase [Paenibacillus sp. J31TS4]GIP37579.1 NAD(P)-dependent oxidoreductase [Paenibacillus sp. J31TS4]